MRLNLDQVVPKDPKGLRKARRAKLKKVRGKGKSERIVFLSTDAPQGAGGLSGDGKSPRRER